MRYRDYKCDGCGNVFKDEDDIVVCPECATPQHRECYNKNGGCVNGHLHSEDFQWQGDKVLTPKENPEEKTKAREVKNDLICPNCQHANPKGSTICQKCGMKFTVFGINLAEKAQNLEEEEKQEQDFPVNPDIEPKMTPPDYPPPFTVGKGERKSEETNLPHNKEEQIENFLSSTIENTTGFTAENGSEKLFKGPYPDNMTIDGVDANTIGAFVARNSGKYIEKFRRLSSGKKLSFNWAAFFFSPYWFFYRKQYKPGIIFMTLNLCLNIIMTPAATEFLSFYEYLATLDASTLTEAATAELLSRMDTLMEPMGIFFGVMLVIKLIAGFVADGLYKSYTIKELQKVSFEPTRNGKLTRIIKFGGISPIMPMAAYFAEQMLSIVAGYFF